MALKEPGLGDWEKLLNFAERLLGGQLSPYIAWPLGLLILLTLILTICAVAMADIGDEQEGRPTVINWQRLGIAFGLSACFDHCLRQSGCAALGRAALEPGGGGLAENVEVSFALFGCPWADRRRSVRKGR